MMLSAWSTGAYSPGTTSVLDLLPERSAEEKARLPELQDITTNSQRTPIGPPAGGYSSTASCMRTVRDALHHYNAEHPGGEFDAVEPLMEDSVHFMFKAWFHINFLARSRSNNNIKRFFAEVRYEARTDEQSFPLIAIVEACTIIEEPFGQYRSSCAFCQSHLDILHPVGDHDFVCGNGKDEDWMIEEWFGMARLIRRRDLASPDSKEEGEKRDA